MAQTTSIILDIIIPIRDNRASISRDEDVQRSPGVQLQEELDQKITADANEQLSKGRKVTIIGTLTGITTASSFSTGLLTVGLPRMAQDLNLASNLLLW